MKFKIELINIGRNDHCDSFTKDFKSKAEAELYAFQCTTDHLASRNVSLSSSDSNTGIYELSAGFRIVGQVKINEIKDDRNI